jgi:hypothetical protein
MDQEPRKLKNHEVKTAGHKKRGDLKTLRPRKTAVATAQPQKRVTNRKNK